MRLALRLGRTLRELLASVSSEELTQWRAFDLMEPLGDERMDFGFGVVASTISNVNKPRGAEPSLPSDFMPIQRLQKTNDEKQTLAARVRTGLLNLTGGRKR